ncbi:MAG TPA: ribokinase [Verrucomicrobiae bacterium]|nr:ribokinase [Verrucomicrobiae bacterium]
MAVTPARLVVIGSLNLDYIASVERLPAPGQTIPATTLIRRFGGKGANQAVAAARQGARVTLIGCVGDDDDGAAYVRRLRAESIDVAGVTRTKKARTGTALIAVDRQAENMIIVAAGANGQLTAKAVLAQREAIGRAGAMLLQFEIPMKTIKAAIQHANRAGVPVILNPSPLRPDFSWGRFWIDTLIVNEGEAGKIFRLTTDKGGIAPKLWCSAMKRTKVRHLIITRGARSTICFSGPEHFEIPSLTVKPVDTVGAGDAFAGAFSARRAEGLDLVSAIRLANCAGALTTLKPGAQEAIPSRLATQRAVRGLL